jgi:hypothetical protein
VRRVISPYEAHCVAWWLWHEYGYSKADATRAVDRFASNNTWFQRHVLGIKYDDKWKANHADEVRQANRKFHHFKKTPMYAALKRDVGDLRALPTVRSKISE